MRERSELKPEFIRPMTEAKFKKSPNKRQEVSREQIERGRSEFNRRKNEMIVKAIRQHAEAVSYRGFRVGSSAIAENPDALGGYQVEASHNFKPLRLAQVGWDKLCAESNTCTIAIMDGATYIPGIVVASHHKEIGQDDVDQTHSSEVLHCCHNCRELFREMISKGIMSGQTMIRFVDDGTLVYEDEQDMESPGIPKLKLKREISETDVAELPHEETTMEDFLEKYKKDKPLKREHQHAKPPYDLVLES